MISVVKFSKQLPGQVKSSKNSKKVSWYFEPSQPQRITSWLKTMFNLSPIYSARKSSNHKLFKNRKISSSATFCFAKILSRWWFSVTAVECSRHHNPTTRAARNVVSHSDCEVRILVKSLTHRWLHRYTAPPPLRKPRPNNQAEVNLKGRWSLARYSYTGIASEPIGDTSPLATRQGTLGNSRLSSLSHCVLILALEVELVCASWSPLSKKKRKFS